MMKWIGIVTILIIICIGCFSHVYAEDYEGVVVREVEVTCVSAPELAKLIRKHISIQPGEKFSQKKIRESIREIYALNRFSQITVEAELVEEGVRLSFCPARFKTISKIQITGNRAIPSDTIRNALEVNIGDWFSPNDLKQIEQRVLDVYRTHGYSQVQLNIGPVEEPGFEEIILAVDIQEGEASKIGTVTFSGQTIFNEKRLLSASKLTPGTQFSVKVMEEGIERVKALYAENGYLDLKFTERNITYNEETGTVDIQLTLIEGLPLSIRFEGNTHVNTKTLRELLRIFTSGRLEEENIRENVEILTEYYKTKGFVFVEVTSQTTKEENVSVLTFIIDEGPRVRVQNITFTGNYAFSTKQLREQMLTDSPGLFSRGFYQEQVFQEDILAIKAFYQQNGYLEADVVSVSKEFSEERDHVLLSLVIQEGIQTRIENVHILGESDENVLKKVQKLLLFKNGEPLNINDVTQSIERIKEFYANQGYIKANVEVSTAFSEDNSQVTMTFKITPGQRFYVGTISIQGVFRTKKVFITRELKIKEGDVYNPQKIRETVRRLNRSGLYENVIFRRLDPKSDNPVQDMLLAVSEISAKDFEFGFGYSTERGLKASVGYSDKNVLNYAGKGTAQAELSVERPKVTLQYIQPHFFSQDTRLIASLYDDIQKDNNSFDIERRGASLVVRHNFSETLSASLGYYFEQADPSNVREYAKLSDLDTKVLNIQGIDSRFSWDIRDDLIQTKKGGFTQLYLRTANNELGSEADFFELDAQTNWYVNVFWDFVIAFSLNGKLIEPIGTSKYVPIYTRYFLGGDNTVRGFKKYSIGPIATDGEGRKVNIGGDRLVRFNAELRFPIYSVFGGVIFYDAGANWLNTEGFDSEDIRDAIGAGLRIATPVGPLRVDYGRKLDRQSGESAGEYYITIGSAF